MNFGRDLTNVTSHQRFIFDYFQRLLNLSNGTLVKYDIHYYDFIILK